MPYDDEWEGDTDAIFDRLYIEEDPEDEWSTAAQEEWDALLDLSDDDLRKLAKEYIDSVDRITVIDVILECRRVKWGDEKTQAE